MGDLPGASTSNTGVIAGGILGASAFVCLVFMAAARWWWQKKNNTVLFSAYGINVRLRKWRWTLKTVCNYERAPSMCQVHVPGAGGDVLRKLRTERCVTQFRPRVSMSAE